MLPRRAKHMRRKDARRPGGWNDDALPRADSPALSSNGCSASTLALGWINRMKFQIILNSPRTHSKRSDARGDGPISRDGPRTERPAGWVPCGWAKPFRGVRGQGVPSVPTYLGKRQYRATTYVRNDKRRAPSSYPRARRRGDSRRGDDRRRREREFAAPGGVSEVRPEGIRGKSTLLLTGTQRATIDGGRRRRTADGRLF